MLTCLYYLRMPNLQSEDLGCRQDSGELSFLIYSGLVSFPDLNGGFPYLMIPHLL